MNRPCDRSDSPDGRQSSAPPTPPPRRRAGAVGPHRGGFAVADKHVAPAGQQQEVAPGHGVGPEAVGQPGEGGERERERGVALHPPPSPAPPGFRSSVEAGPPPRFFFWLPSQREARCRQERGDGDGDGDAGRALHRSPGRRCKNRVVAPCPPCPRPSPPPVPPHALAKTKAKTRERERSQEGGTRLGVGPRRRRGTLGELPPPHHHPGRRRSPPKPQMAPPGKVLGVFTARVSPAGGGEAPAPSPRAPRGHLPGRGHADGGGGGAGCRGRG